MKKYIVASPGRAASNSLQNHIFQSLHKQGIPNEVESLEMPILWPETVEDPENWTVVVSTRRDMLAQVISFYSIVHTQITHSTGKQGNETKNVSIENFSIPRTYFFTFAYGILFFHYRIFNYTNWDKFKKVHWLIYEDIVKDWQATGQLLGFDDWTNDSKHHAKGHGRVWDKVINKEEVLAWAKELQLDNQFIFDEEKYQ
jgi:hypothetical protein